MDVVYDESIVEKVADAKHAAAKIGRKIKHIELTQQEVRELYEFYSTPGMWHPMGPWARRNLDREQFCVVGEATLHEVVCRWAPFRP